MRNPIFGRKDTKNNGIIIKKAAKNVARTLLGVLE